MVMFISYALVSCIFYGIGKLPRLMGQALLTNLIVIPVIILISFSTAIMTRKRGLEPDNFIIPIETSISDGLTTIALLVALTLIV